MTVTEWTFKLPLVKPLSLNDRQNYWVRSAAVKQLRDDVHRLCQAHKVPKCERISVHLLWHPGPLVRRRDPLNLVATLKAVEDGVVQAGVVPDDTPQYVKSVMPEIGEKVVAVGELWVTIESLE
jgi:crossover junction endodeoxyribonuclease RusA